MEERDILEYHQPERDLRCRVISGVRTGNEAGVLGELWCPFPIQERQIHDALSFRINRVIGEG
jgi:hypothetical protein